MTQTKSRPAGNRAASLSDGRAAGSLDAKVAPDVRDPFMLGYQLGYQLGYGTGYDVGYRRAELDMERTGTTCGAVCTGCSRCRHTRSWSAAGNPPMSRAGARRAAAARAVPAPSG